MVGLLASGKTTILYKLKLGKVVTTIPTIGFNLETIECKDTQITFWDVAGHTKTWMFYYSNIDAVIFVVDSTDKMYIRESEIELHKLLEAEELKNCVFLVFANKQDLPDAMSVAVLTEELKLDTIKDRKWHIQEASACQGFGLYEGLDFILNELTKK